MGLSNMRHTPGLRAEVRQLNNTHPTDDCFLLLTARCSNARILTDEGRLADLLTRLVEAIDMNPLKTPAVTQAFNNPGLEAYVPIDDSNITVSTYTNSERIVICIHSCKPFETARIVRTLTEVADCSQIRQQLCRESEFKEVDS